VTILGRTFAQYAFHLLSHKIPLLWRLHRVHHCDEHLDATSTLRNHPLELIASAVFVGAIVAISGLSPAVLIVYESIETLLNLLAHANVRLPQPAERVARALFFITPPCIAFIVPRGRKKRTATTAPCFRSGIICSAPIGTRLPNSRPFASDWTRSVANARKASKLNWRCPGDPSYLFVRR
jgi:fatty acid hydroxylase family protein